MRLPRRARTPRVEMLSRPGCHLCEQMLQVVSQQVPTVVVRDIDAERRAGVMDEREHDGWTTQVPVLLVDGSPVARWQIDPAELRAALSARRRR
ncbi:glutaredoxin family protein [Serinicoccus chungangensis]|uniref:glutaredoxin family protein n=1 Tax=Serinicoccus chungangensis TaxID=767452 RepID=UPI001EE82E96|nr:glutaredoxin family protein [Serinicoccus chungangensis]